MKTVFFKWLVLSILLCIGCASGESSATAPITTIDVLLEFHGMRGRMPEERPREARQKAVDENALKQFFLDFESEDPFLANLYVGFVVGALARHQHALVMTQKGNRVVVHAGDLPVAMTYHKGKWLIILKKTIPQSIRRRAEAEKERLSRQSIAKAS